MLDVTNPDAVDWMKRIIQDQIVTEASSSGWMADFGEYLPFDAVLSSGAPADSIHNLYPQLWAQINSEVTTPHNRTSKLFVDSHLHLITYL